MVVVSHLFLFLWQILTGRYDSHESYLPCLNHLFPDSPFCMFETADRSVLFVYWQRAAKYGTAQSTIQNMLK
jgi:hypothetical protein